MIWSLETGGCSSIFGRSRQQTVPSLVRASLRLPPRLHFHFSKYLIKILEFTGCPKKTHFQNAAAGPTVHWLNHQWPTPLVSGNRFIGRFSLKLSQIKPSQVMYMVKFGPTVLNFSYPAWQAWQTVPPEWGRGRLFDGSTKFFFYENSCNSGMESRKIDPKVGTKSHSEGYK